MRIELSDLTFTEQDDIIPESGEVVILNTNIANTLAGNDSITGTISEDFTYYYDPENYSGFINMGVLNTDDGSDVITGTLLYDRHSNRPPGYHIINFGTLNTGEGNDMIDGSSYSIGSYAVYRGIYNSGTLNTGEGDDTITSYAIGLDGFSNIGTLNMEGGNDIITAFAGDNFAYGYLSTGFINEEGSTLNMGDGNDTIVGGGNTSYTGIFNRSDINTGNGDDSIISQGTFVNGGGVFLGHGNDSITITHGSFLGGSFVNSNFIETGDGNDDIIISGDATYNYGIINTGNGDDSIIVDGVSYENGMGYGISNYGGTINMGDGNDSIIANTGFESAPNSSGAWFLGDGEDYIKGYGNGDFYGGNGNDTLELTSGTYTVGIWGERGESPIFTKGNQFMITSEFETLIAGSTIYDFTSLTAGQIIIVA